MLFQFIETHRNISGNVEFSNDLSNIDKVNLWGEFATKLNAIGPAQKNEMTTKVIGEARNVG